MRAVDTSVLVRLIARDDAEQVDAAERFVVSGAWVSHIVLVETVWVLGSVYGLAAARIARAVAMLLEHDQLVLQDGDVVRAALHMFQNQSKVGFADCLIVQAAHKAGHQPVATFDNAMSSLQGATSL